METSEDRRRRLLEMMGRSLESPITDNPPDLSGNTPTMRPTQPVANPPLPSPSVQIPENVPLAAPQGDVAKTPPIRIGYSTAGLTGVDRLMKQREAYESADPESKVKTNGDFVEIDPPNRRKGFKGRLKSLGEGVLTGLAMSDPDRPLQGLGMAIGGGGMSAINTRGGAQLKRRFEMNQLDNDIARGLKLEQEDTQLDGMRALARQRELEPALKAEQIQRETEAVNAKLEIERQKAAGLITKQEADRQQRELDRASREKIAADRIVSNEKIASTRPTGESSQTVKREAKLNLSSSLYKKAEALEANAAALDEHIAKLEAGKATYSQGGQVPTPDDIKPFDSQIDELRKQQQKLKSEANELRMKGDGARAEGESIPEVSSSSRKLPSAVEKKLRDAAKAKNLDPDEAVRRALARQ